MSTYHPPYNKIMRPSYPILRYGFLLLLAIGLTVLSGNFVMPADCQAACDRSSSAPCPPHTCGFGEQRAGLPLPFWVDDPGGGSPTSGWGILGPEDLPNPMIFLLDTGFYFLLLWLGGTILQVLRRQEPLELLAIVLPSALLLAGLVAGYLLYQPVLNR